MHTRAVTVLSFVAVLLLMVSSTVVVANDQLFPRARKIPGGAWLSAHHQQEFGKRGRFVFRDAPYGHYFDSNYDDTDGSVDKRNWRL